MKKWKRNKKRKRVEFVHTTREYGELVIILCNTIYNEKNSKKRAWLLL